MTSEIFTHCLIAAIAAVGLVGLSSACDPLNPSVPPVDHLNRTRLESKRWYIQEKFYTRAQDVTQPSVNCYIHYVDRYERTYFKFNEKFTYFASGEFRHVEYDGDTLGNVDAVWQVSRGNPPPIGASHVTVFAFTDYETYGVMHWCPYTDHADWEHVLIFTGSPNPDQELLEQLRNQVEEELGFTTEFGIKYEHPADCRYE